MQIVSNEFLQAMGSHPYVARITLDGTDVIQGEAIQEIYFRGGANSSEDTILLGSAFAGSVEITLDEAAVNCTIEGRELAVELGIRLTEGTQWIPMGVYTAENPTAADDVLTVKAIDALGAKFDVAYEPLAGFDFSTNGGVSSTDFLAALCARRGVEADVSGKVSIPLNGAPGGFTERQIIGFISALYGGFANIDRLGVLRIRSYAEVDAQVSADTYYEDGLEKATYSFTPGWLKCYNEAADLTMFVGDFDAQQGINLESIWMNQTILNGLWEKLKSFAYRPVPELSFLGNPLVDPGDILTLEDDSGEKVKVPVMTLSHEYDGGIITSISAYGQAKTTDYQSPTRRAVIRSTEKAKQYAASESDKLDQLELLKRLTKEWVDDGIYLTDAGKIGIRASAIITGLLASMNGIMAIDLDAGDIKSTKDAFSLIITNAMLRMLSSGNETFCLDNEAEGLPIVYMSDYKGGIKTNVMELTPHHLKIGGTSLRPKFMVQASGERSEMTVDAINPGKKSLFSGSCAVGSSCTIGAEEAAKYDVFAIKLGDDSGTSDTVVLAYKTGSAIRGVGGWAGTSTDAKQLYFFSATFSGDTWTVQDAGVHVVNYGGGIEAGTRLHLKEVIGVI